jgi:hypothetical protein
VDRFIRYTANHISPFGPIHSLRSSGVSSQCATHSGPACLEFIPLPDFSEASFDIGENTVTKSIHLH